MSIQDTDKTSAAVAKAPRVALTDIERSMAAIYYNTADVLAGQGSVKPPAEHMTLEQLKVMTVCVVVMDNGFVVLGKSAPASPENFNIEIGKKFAYEDCVRQLWPLMGYELRSHLYQRANFGTGPQKGSG